MWVDLLLIIIYLNCRKTGWHQKGKACICLLYNYLFAGAAVLEVVGYAPPGLLLSAVSEITQLYNYDQVVVAST